MFSSIMSAIAAIPKIVEAIRDLVGLVREGVEEVRKNRLIQEHRAKREAVTNARNKDEKAKNLKELNDLWNSDD